MRQRVSGGRGRSGQALLPLFFSVLLLGLPFLADASESCSMLGGKCRDACGPREQAEAGDFEDCGAKQECCVGRTETPAQCCVMSFDARDFGPSNCRIAEGGACAKGSASPVPCARLQMCATIK